MRKRNMKEFGYTIALVILMILVVSFIVFEFVLLCIYGDKPIDEIPTWVLWFLWRNRR